MPSTSADTPNTKPSSDQEAPQPPKKKFESYDPLFGQNHDKHVDFDGFDDTMFPD